MKKFLLTALAASLSWAFINAVPAKPEVRTYTQSDGSTLSVRVVGDEWHHGFVTLDGYTVERVANGDFYYRTSSGVSSVSAHDATQRSSAERAYVSANAEGLTLGAQISATTSAKRARANARRKATQVPQSGSPRIPIILVNYSDVKHKSSDPKAAFEAQFNTKDKSCYQYFVDQSYGQFTPQYDIIGPVQLPNNRADYGGNDYRGDDKGVATMVIDAVKKCTDVDFSVYDNNGDGDVDVVVILYAGVGEAQAYGIVPNAVWPCQWELSDAATYGDGTGAMTVNGVTIDKFAVFNELYGSSDNTTRLDGVGTFCHEFSHCLGLPDFYETTYSYGIYGMGSWSLLDSGCYNGDGDNPCGYTGYEREFMGWLNLTEAVPGTTYTLGALSAQGEKAIKVTNDKNANEYYVLENRQRTGWDADLPAAGLLITHVDYDAEAWANNEVNNTRNHTRMTPIPADNNLSTSSEAGDLWPYNGKTELTDSSTPAAKVYTGSYMGKPIADITKSGDKVSFTFMPGVVVREAPELIEPTNVTTTGFTANWTAVEDAVSYNLQVAYVDTTVVVPDYVEYLTEGFSYNVFDNVGSQDLSNSLDDYMENTGWTGKKLYMYEGGIRLGSSNATGSLVSPAIDLQDLVGPLRIKLSAGTYNNDTNVALLITAGGESKTITLPDSTTADYYVELDIDPAEAVNVSFATAASRKRVIIRDLTIYSGDAEAAGLPLREPVETGDTLLRTITGITGTSYTVDNLAAGGRYTVKVQSVYADDGTSSWSTRQTVQLFSAGVLDPGDVNGDGIVDLVDLNILINAILGLDVDYPTDISGDGEVDLTDINMVINAMLNN